MREVHDYYQDLITFRSELIVVVGQGNELVQHLADLHHAATAEVLGHLLLLDTEGLGQLLLLDTEGLGQLLLIDTVLTVSQPPLYWWVCPHQAKSHHHFNTKPHLSVQNQNYEVFLI